MANRYYVGTGTVGSPTGWNSTSYWSTTSGGASGASVPGISDTAFFDNYSGYCTTDVAVSIAYLSINTGLSGSWDKVVLLGSGFSLTVSGSVSVGNSNN